MEIRNLIKKYMEDKMLTQEKFAKALNISANTNASRVTISNWLNGRYEPGTDFLLQVARNCDDWRMDFAIDCLCAKLPEVFERDPHGTLTMRKVVGSLAHV